MTSVASLPAIAVHIGSFAADQTEVIQALRVQHRLSQPSLCEVTFAAPTRRFRDALACSIASELRVVLGNSPDALFSGDITAFWFAHDSLGGDTVTVRSYDLLHRLRKRQPLRALMQLTVETLAKELVSDVGLSVASDRETPALPRILQYFQSDFDLLARTAARYGLYLTLRKDVLHLISMQGFGDPVELQLGKNLLHAEVSVNAESACRSITVLGWDPQRVETHRGRSTADPAERDFVAEASPTAFGSSGERTLAARTTPSDVHAEAMARAELERRSADEVIFSGIAEGDLRLNAGSRVTVRGLADRLDGTYVLTSVNHEFTRDTGFTSQLSSEPLQLSTRSGGPVVVIGTVSNVQDPENLGRVRVTLPTLGGIESEWMGVVTPGAGAGKGMVMLPDINDQVIVVLMSDDPSLGFVIGGLYGTHGPEDYGVEGAAVKRYSLATRGGQKIRMDDSASLIRLENHTGSLVEFGPERTLLHSATDLTIEAPGRRILVRGKAIDFEEA